MVLEEEQSPEGSNAPRKPGASTELHEMEERELPKNSVQDIFLTENRSPQRKRVSQNS